MTALIATIGPLPGSFFEDAYWDYGLTLAWIIYRDMMRAQSFSEQAPRALGNVLIETVWGAKAAKRGLLKHLRDGSQRAVSVDQTLGTTKKIKARQWLAVRLFFDDAGVAYLAPSGSITRRVNGLLRFKKSDVMKLWPAPAAEIAHVTTATKKVPASKIGVESAIKAIFADGVLAKLKSKDRNSQIRRWLKENNLSTVSDRTINRALTGK